MSNLADLPLRVVKPELSPKGRAVLDEFWALSKLGGPSGLADEWKAMDDQERDFWLRASRQPRHLATRAEWFALPGGVRDSLKNNFYRCAIRAQKILGVPV